MLEPVQMATVLIYLSAPEEGGETVFPLEGEHGLNRLPTINYRSCDQGLKVKSLVGVHAIALIEIHIVPYWCLPELSEKWSYQRYAHAAAWQCASA